MAHARRCVVRDFAFSYSVDAESTEEYTIIGTKKRWFKNDVVAEKFDTGTTSFSLTYTPVVLKSGDYCLSVILDGVYLDEVASSPATGEYSVSGTTITTYDTRTAQLIAVYQAVPVGNNWSDVSDSTIPAAVRGTDVPVLIGANGIERIQSITINGTFNPEAVKELGNRDLVGYQMQIPQVTGTITVLDTDTELIALFTTGQLAPSGVTEFGVSEFTASGLSMTIKLQLPTDTTEPYEIIKTLYMPELVVTSEGFTSNVNQNAQQTFDYKSRTGELVIYDGAKP
jgi:hypothetical protein